MNRGPAARGMCRSPAVGRGRMPARHGVHGPRTRDASTQRAGSAPRLGGPWPLCGPGSPRVPRPGDGVAGLLCSPSPVRTTPTRRGTAPAVLRSLERPRGSCVRPPGSGSPSVDGYSDASDRRLAPERGPLCTSRPDASAVPRTHGCSAAGPRCSPPRPGPADVRGLCPRLPGVAAHTTSRVDKPVGAPSGLRPPAAPANSARQAF